MSLNLLHSKTLHDSVRQVKLHSLSLFSADWFKYLYDASGKCDLDGDSLGLWLEVGEPLRRPWNKGHLLITDGCIRTRSSSHPGPTIRHILDTLISRDMNEAADNLHGFTPPRNSGIIPITGPGSHFGVCWIVPHTRPCVSPDNEIKLRASGGMSPGASPSGQAITGWLTHDSLHREG